MLLLLRLPAHCLSQTTPSSIRATAQSMILFPGFASNARRGTVHKVASNAGKSRDGSGTGLDARSSYRNLAPARTWPPLLSPVSSCLVNHGRRGRLISSIVRGRSTELQTRPGLALRLGSRWCAVEQVATSTLQIPRLQRRSLMRPFLPGAYESLRPQRVRAERR